MELVIKLDQKTKITYEVEKEIPATDFLAFIDGIKPTLMRHAVFTNKDGTPVEKKKRKYTKSAWTEEQVKTLIEMKTAGERTKLIAEKTGHTPSATSQQIAVLRKKGLLT